MRAFIQINHSIKLHSSHMKINTQFPHRSKDPFVKHTRVPGTQPPPRTFPRYTLASTDCQACCTPEPCPRTCSRRPGDELETGPSADESACSRMPVVAWPSERDNAARCSLVKLGCDVSSSAQTVFGWPSALPKVCRIFPAIPEGILRPRCSPKTCFQFAPACCPTLSKWSKTNLSEKVARLIRITWSSPSRDQHHKWSSSSRDQHHVIMFQVETLNSLIKFKLYEFSWKHDS